MKKIKLFITIFICKSLVLLLHIFGFTANNLPGNFCIKFYRNILTDMQLPELIILITGTNGKTVSSISLTHILREKGLTVVNNNGGSNLNSGIISEFIKHSTLLGRIKADAAVLEVDEDATANLCKEIHPDYLIVTNLYRDSISRNAHPEFVYDKLVQIPADVKLILNADDMISGTLGSEQNEKIFFGAQAAPGRTEVAENIICDVKICPQCSMPITYEYIQYHHIGRAHCDHCGFQMPEADIYAENIKLDPPTFLLNDRIRKQSTVFAYKTKNLFEIYNILSIVALCLDLGYTLDFIKQSLDSLKDAGGRYEETIVNDTQIISMVAKSQNPISCSQSFTKAKNTSGEKIIILAINDREYGMHSHHEDTSWFYDTDFEFLVSEAVINYIAVGPRAYDVALRLVLAGADPEKIKFSFDYNTTDITNLIDYEAVKGGSILFFFEVYFRKWSKKMKLALAEEGKKYENN